MLIDAINSGGQHRQDCYPDAACRLSFLWKSIHWPSLGTYNMGMVKYCTELHCIPVDQLYSIEVLNFCATGGMTPGTYIVREVPTAHTTIKCLLEVVAVAHLAQDVSLL